MDDSFRDAKTFYLTFGTVTLLGALAVLIPNVPLVTILVATQVLNAVLLVPLLFAMIGIGRDRDLMGRFTIGRPARSPTASRPPWWCCASVRCGHVAHRISGHTRHRLARRRCAHPTHPVFGPI